MPANEKGIDVRVGGPVPIDPDSLGDRLGRTGVSIREGTRVPVTRVHLFVNDVLAEIRELEPGPR